MTSVLRSTETDRIDRLERATSLLARALNQVAMALQDVSKVQADPHRYGGRGSDSASGHLSEAYGVLNEVVDILSADQDKSGQV